MRSFGLNWRRPSCLLLLALSVGCSDGVQVEGDPTLPALSRHDDGFAGTHYSGAGQCSTCHDGLQDASGNDVSIVQDWSSSMMANSSRDPYWRAKVVAEMARNPQLQAVLEDGCTRCHAPMANDVARKEGIDLPFTADGLFDDEHALFDQAMDGVSCTLCHQMADDELLGTPEGSSGNFSVAVQQNASQRPAYGPYSDPVATRMLTQVRFNPVHGPHLSGSQTCAACHDLRTSADPQLDGSGAHGFPEQMVFSEWQNSIHAMPGEQSRTCQDCHMPEVSGAMQLSSEGGGLPRDGFSRHTFLGANTVMQNMMMQFSDELGIDVPALQFEQSIERNRQFLSTAARVEIVDAVLEQQQLQLVVSVQNLSGHKLPSGFPSRRAYLHLRVSDSDGNTVFESGALNADGSVIGIDADLDSERYEPHYELIESPDQVQVYESIMGDVAEQVTHTLMDATVYLKDNRLLPAGFVKSAAADDIATRGLALDDADFQAGGDEIVYRIPVQEGDSFSVLVELMYQPLAFGHIQDLFADSTLAEVARFRTLFQAVSLKAERIASASSRLSR